ECEVLSDHLPVDAAGRRHVDDQVTEHPHGTTEPMALAQWPATPVVGLERAGCAHVVLARLDRPGREAARLRHDLAASTDPLATAHGVQVLAERPGGVEH